MTAKQWFTLPNGRQVYRFPPVPAVARSGLPSPHFRTDTIDPCRSMADGKMYDSLSGLRRTYRADGNPQGEEYIELGNAEIRSTPPERKALDKSEVADIVDRAQAAISSGEV